MLCYCGVMVVRHVKMLKVRALPQSLNCSLSSNIPDGFSHVTWENLSFSRIMHLHCNKSDSKTVINLNPEVSLDINCRILQCR